MQRQVYEYRCCRMDPNSCVTHENVFRIKLQDCKIAEEIGHLL